MANVSTPFQIQIKTNEVQFKTTELQFKTNDIRFKTHDIQIKITDMRIKTDDKLNVNDIQLQRMYFFFQTGVLEICN